MVAAKVALKEAAARAGVEVKKDMSDADIKKAVILSVFPAAKLDGKDDAYLAARFDSAVETMESRNDGVSRVVAGENYTSDTKCDSVSAHEKMVQGMRDLSNGVKPGKEG